MSIQQVPSEKPTPILPRQPSLRQPWHRPELVELPIHQTASGDVHAVEGSGIFDGDLLMFTTTS